MECPSSYLSKIIAERRQSLRQLLKCKTAELVLIPRDKWPIDGDSSDRVAVYLSCDFLVQVFHSAGQFRISVNRTRIASDGKWKDGITWDELQNIKTQIGFQNVWAVEVFPPTDRTVNVSNMRHLWIVPKPAFAW